jgi:hypothetical protein
MSKLRQQLDTAKDAYTSAKYPGDLVADLRRREGFSPWRLLLPLAPFAAIAAVIALVVMLMPEPPTKQIGIDTVALNPPAQTDVVDALLPEAMAMPSDAVTSMPAETLTVPSMTSVPSMPTIPTWSVSTDVSLDESNQG